MKAIEVYPAIQEIIIRHGSTPLCIDILAAEMGIGRIELISYLVDLSIAGYLDFDRTNVCINLRDDNSPKA